MGDDALLRYTLTTRHPTTSGNLELIIDASGAVLVGRDGGEPEPTGSMIDEPDVRLRSVLTDGGFFDLEPMISNEAATDGIVRELCWNGDLEPRTVTVDRARSPELDAIVAGIGRLTGVRGL